MKTIILYRRLLRIEQWYKNVVVFLPLIFASPALRYPVFEVIIGFCGLCAVSSMSYILNDWIDRDRDRLHPVKRLRPLASGTLSGTHALFITLILLVCTGGTVWYLGSYFGSLISIYALLTTTYSLGLKNIPLLDIGIIAGNFTVRMLAGMNTIPGQLELQYFILLFCILIMFLTHKRRADIKLLGVHAASHKPVLSFYTRTNCYVIRIMSFIGEAISLWYLWANGMFWLTSISIFALSALTSIVFSQNPSLVIKPHYLVTIWYWDLLAALTIYLCFAS